MSFYDEDINLSYKTYSFDPTGHWNLVEQHPDDQVIIILTLEECF